MTKISYTFQWLVDFELGVWEDAPIKEPTDELSANRIFNLATKKHPNKKWRLLRVTTEIIRDSSED